MKEEKCPTYVIGIVIFFIVTVCIFPDWFFGLLIFCILLYIAFKSEDDSKTLRVTREEYNKLKEMDRQIYEAEEELKRVVIQKMVEHHDDPKYVASCIEEINSVDREREARKEEDKRIKIIDDYRRTR